MNNYEEIFTDCQPIMKRNKLTIIFLLIFISIFFSAVISKKTSLNSNFFLVHAQTNGASNNILLDSFGELLKKLFMLIDRDLPPGANDPTPTPGGPNPSSIPTLPPPDYTPPPIPPGKMGSVLQWAIEITNRLEGEDVIWTPWVYYNRLLNPPSNGGYTAAYAPATSLANLYWCTYLVADAFNLAGISGLSRSAHATVKNMQQFFITTSGYKYISYSVRFINYFASPPTYQPTSIIERKMTLSNVIPGCATFFQEEPGVHVPYGNHVAILRSKSIDANYNGFIETYDSNNTNIVVRYPVYEGNVQNTLFVEDSLRGFGCL